MGIMTSIVLDGNEWNMRTKGFVRQQGAITKPLSYLVTGQIGREGH